MRRQTFSGGRHFHFDYFQHISFRRHAAAIIAAVAPAFHWADYPIYPRPWLPPTLLSPFRCLMAYADAHTAGSFITPPLPDADAAACRCHADFLRCCRCCQVAPAMTGCFMLSPMLPLLAFAALLRRCRRCRRHAAISVEISGMPPFRYAVIS